MTHPLRKTESPAAPRFDRFGTPWSEYVRRIDFLDRGAPGPLDAPVHVLTGAVLFDGALAPCRINREGVTVDLSNHDGTVVTLWVHRDDMQVGRVEEDGTYTPHLLGGRRVLTPLGEGWDWVPVDPEDDDDPWMAVSVFVAEVSVR